MVPGPVEGSGFVVNGRDVRPAPAAQDVASAIAAVHVRHSEAERPSARAPDADGSGGPVVEQAKVNGDAQQAEPLETVQQAQARAAVHLEKLAVRVTVDITDTQAVPVAATPVSSVRRSGRQPAPRAATALPSACARTRAPAMETIDLFLSQSRSGDEVRHRPTERFYFISILFYDHIRL